MNWLLRVQFKVLVLKSAVFPVDRPDVGKLSTGGIP
jgi:hypothetical protein